MSFVTCAVGAATMIGRLNAERYEAEARRAAGLPPRPRPAAAPSPRPDTLHTPAPTFDAGSFVAGVAVASTAHEPPSSPPPAPDFTSGGGGDFGGGGADGSW